MAHHGVPDQVIADTDPEVPSEQLGLLDAVAERLDRFDAEHPGVAEPDRFETERQRDGDQADQQGQGKFVHVRRQA